MACFTCRKKPKPVQPAALSPEEEAIIQRAKQSQAQAQIERATMVNVNKVNGKR